MQGYLRIGVAVMLVCAMGVPARTEVVDPEPVTIDPAARFTAPVGGGPPVMDTFNANDRGSAPSPGDGACAASAPNGSCAVTGLSNGTQYIFEVKGTNLTGVTLEGADLKGTDLTDPKLAGADLKGADLSGAPPPQAPAPDSTSAQPPVSKSSFDPPKPPGEGTQNPKDGSAGNTKVKPEFRVVGVHGKNKVKILVRIGDEWQIRTVKIGRNGVGTVKVKGVKVTVKDIGKGKYRFTIKRGRK